MFGDPVRMKKLTEEYSDKDALFTFCEHQNFFESWNAGQPYYSPAWYYLDVRRCKMPEGCFKPDADIYIKMRELRNHSRIEEDTVYVLFEYLLNTDRNCYWLGVDKIPGDEIFIIHHWETTKKDERVPPGFGENWKLIDDKFYKEE